MIGKYFFRVVLFYNRIGLTMAFRFYCILLVGLSYHSCCTNIYAFKFVVEK